MNTIENLKWRSATKKFDPSKSVSDADLEILIEAANLAPTSFGIQPFQLVVVKNKELQSDLVEISYGQTQVADASHVLVMAIETEIGQEQVDNYFDRMAEVRNMEPEALAGYKEMMSGYMTTMDDSIKPGWAAKQAYIALGTLMTAAAELKIDACPMEGFDAVKFQSKLGLASKRLMPVVILPIGYRAEDDELANAPKVRKKRSDFVVEVN